MTVSRQKVREAGEISSTDKVIVHSYERFFPTFLSQINPNPNIMEIGYFKGGSVGFWKHIFPNCRLIYLDNKNKTNKDEYCQIIKCDQSSTDQLLSTCNKLKNSSFDLIVDDGSHISEHQLLTFNILFKLLLMEGGYYVIEDIETSYWHNVYHYGVKCNSCGIGSKNSTIEHFKMLIDYVNREFLALMSFLYYKDIY